MSFDVAAEAYDRFMGRYSVQLSAQMADLAGELASVIAAAYDAMRSKANGRGE